MSKNMPSLLAIAAEMRAVGHPWETVAHKVHRKARTCQQWPARYGPVWDKVYGDAQRRRFEETRTRPTPTCAT